MLAKLRDAYADQLDLVARHVTQSTGLDAEGPLAGFARENLRALEDDQLRLAMRHVRQYLGDVRSVVLDSVLAGQTVRPRKVLLAASGRTFANLEAELRTGLMGFQRLVAIEKAKQLGLTKLLYVGPLDKVARPFCRERVGRVFTLAEVRAMDNGQGLPVPVYCGGWNCRHHWRPVSDELAEELGKAQN